MVNTMQTILEEKTRNLSLIVGHLRIEGVENKKNRNKGMEKTIKELEADVKQNPNKFLSKPELLAYQKLAETKSSIPSTDSAAKILISIILDQGRLPTISRVVDCMNVVSVKAGLTISTWDMEKLKGKVRYKMSEGKEKYWPFMGDELELEKDELAIFDDEKVLGLVRYRDSKYAPVTLDTKNILVHMQGINGISRESIQAALDELEKLILENTGGKTVNKLIHE